MLFILLVKMNYALQGISLNGCNFEWIGTKFQLVDTLTKSGTS